MHCTKKKLAFCFSIAIITIFAALIVCMILAQRDLLVESRKQSLQIYANEKAFLVNSFLENQKEKLATIAALDDFQEVALNPNDSIKIEAAKRKILELKRVLPGIAVLTKEGIIIVSETNPAGTDYSFLPQFPVTDSSVVTFVRYYDQVKKRDFYAIGGPLHDPADSSKVIGVITFDVALDNVGDLMTAAEAGDTNEVYLIDSTGLLLSKSAYVGKNDKSGVLLQEVTSDGAKACLEDLKKYGEDTFIEKHEEIVPRYLNYMGTDVFGAHAYVPEIMGCVLAEESVEEVSKVSMFSYIKDIFTKEIQNEN